MREFNDPHYNASGCLCCKATPEDVLNYRQRLLEALKQEEERSRLGFIQYKVLERIIEDVK